MATTGINPTRRKGQEGGEGLFGSVLGGILGSVLGGAVGSIAGPAGTAVGASLGGSLGGAGGGAVGNEFESGTPGGDSPNQVPQMATGGSESVLSKMSKMPEVQMAKLQNSRNLLATSNVPGAQDYIGQIDEAKKRLQSQLGNNSSLGF